MANKPISQTPSVCKNGVDYVVKTGSAANLVFRCAFGHRRNYLNIEDLTETVGVLGLVEVSSEDAMSLPAGPPMPRAKGAELDALLADSTESDRIRETFCKRFSGSGFEIGAGRRPTMVPKDCNVEYVDKFTFEEAKDGSFAGLVFENFVSVSHFESMDDLASIPENSSNFAIACHVIEHVPNVIPAITNTLSRIRQGGFFFLVIPNRDYIFDQNRPITTLEHFVADELSENVPMFEHYLEYANRSKHAPDWISEAKSMYESGADFHVHTFTPSSMEVLLNHLASRNVFTSYELHNPTHCKELCEFYVVIKK